MAEDKLFKLSAALDKTSSEKLFKFAIIGDGPVALVLASYLIENKNQFKLPIEITLFTGTYGYTRRHVVDIKTSLLNDIEQLIKCDN